MPSDIQRTMAGKVEKCLSSGTKLPEVMIGRSCLVSTVSAPKSTNINPKDVASNWCMNLRSRYRILFKELFIF